MGFQLVESGIEGVFRVLERLQSQKKTVAVDNCFALANYSLNMQGLWGANEHNRRGRPSPCCVSVPSLCTCVPTEAKGDTGGIGKQETCQLGGLKPSALEGGIKKEKKKPMDFLSESCEKGNRSSELSSGQRSPLFSLPLFSLCDLFFFHSRTRFVRLFGPIVQRI